MRKIVKTMVLLCLVLCPVFLHASGHLPPGDEKRGRTSFYRGAYGTAIEEYLRLWIQDRKVDKKLL